MLDGSMQGGARQVENEKNHHAMRFKNFAGWAQPIPPDYHPYIHSNQTITIYPNIILQVDYETMRNHQSVNR